MREKSGKERMKEASDRGRITQRNRAIDNYNNNPSICKQCGKKIPLDGRKPSIVKIKQFCNHSCSAIYNNSHKESKLPKAQCLYCQKEFYVYRSSFGKFCSKECNILFRNKKGYERFLNGELTYPKTIRKYLKQYKPYKCCKCGNEGSWQGKELVLEVEHLDGNSENNLPNNLDWICPNCHSQTDTYKGKNKGNGRHKRRQRYSEGKSY